MTATTFRPASPKQIALIKKLAVEKMVDTLTPAKRVTFDEIMGDLETDIRDASSLIDEMFTLKRKPEPKAEPGTPALTAGLYKAPNGDIIKVKPARATGNLYAQVMVSANGGERINLNDEIVPKFDFVYTPGLIRHITPGMKLTLEDAKQFYTRTGRCLNCKKELKVATSIAKGLGPTCAKMFGA